MDVTVKVPADICLGKSGVGFYGQLTTSSSTASTVGSVVLLAHAQYLFYQLAGQLTLTRAVKLIWISNNGFSNSSATLQAPLLAWLKIAVELLQSSPAAVVASCHAALMSGSSIPSGLMLW